MAEDLLGFDALMAGRALLGTFPFVIFPFVIFPFVIFHCVIFPSVFSFVGVRRIVFLLSFCIFSL